MNVYKMELVLQEFENFLPWLPQPQVLFVYKVQGVVME